MRQKNKHFLSYTYDYFRHTAMCTWNKRHPDLFSQIPGEHPILPETSKGEESIENKVEKTSVERQLDFRQHLHV